MHLMAGLVCGFYQRGSENEKRNKHLHLATQQEPIPDEMNTSFGPRIDADRWDFHDGIDLPALVGTPVHAIADAVVHRAGPADKTDDLGFGSTHVVLQVVDPKDGKNDLFLFHLHLDSIAEGVIPGRQVQQGELIGAVGQEDATYPHLHFEFRKGGTEQARSVHPLNYMPYFNKANFKKPRLDRSNFYLDNGEKRSVRLFFEARNRREGDLQAVHVELKGVGIRPVTFTSTSMTGTQSTAIRETRPPLRTESPWRVIRNPI